MASRFVLPLADVGSGISPSDGATLDFFETGSTTVRKNTFSNEALTVANANPVISNGDGVFPDIFIPDGDRYKVILKDKNGVQINESDPVVGAVSAALSSKTFNTVAAMVASIELNIGDIVDTAGYITTDDGGGNLYEVVAAGTGTADGGTFINLATHQAKGLFPGSVVTVMQFGAVGDGVTDDATAIQAAIDHARTTFDSSVGSFTARLDFGGRNHRVQSSINLTLLRQPGFTMQNGGLFGAVSGKIVLDMAGTNTVRLLDFNVDGDETLTPSVGIYIGRAEISGGFPASANASFQNVFTNGFFNKCALLNFASEVSNNNGCFFANKSRSLTSYCYINAGHAQTLVDFVGAVTSDFATLPVPSDGAMSNILHYEGKLQCQRTADVVIPIISISKTNPGVVTVSSANLIASGLSNGDTIFFHDVAGMTELNGTVQTIANLSQPGGTFQLSGTDTTSFGTFTSGTVFNQTGPAMLLSGTHAMTCDSSFLLAYGNSMIRIDEENAITRDNVFNMHCEPQPLHIIDIRAASGTKIIQKFTLNLLNTSQTIKDEVIKLVGAATAIRFDGLTLDIANMGTAPTNGIFSDATKFQVRNADIQIPLAAAMNTISTFADFSGKVYFADTTATEIYDIGKLVLGSSGALTETGGMRFASSLFKANDGAERNVTLSYVSSDAALNDISNAINTTSKYQGKPVFNVTNNKLVVASGGTAGSVWTNSGTGATENTPV